MNETSDTRNLDIKSLDSNDMDYIDMPTEKKHVSFSFNLDFDNSDSCDSADSETANLQIDVSEVHDCNPPNKRKRLTSEETSVLNEMEEEIERQLDAKAAKTNLTPINVKNILKHVISDEQVKAMVQRQLKNSSEDVVFEPKLTRSKAKELAISQTNLPWPHITPIKKTASKVQALIETELSEDSSDEEYNPADEEQQSDDERETENSVGSDVDSLPATPATPTEETSVTVDSDKVNVVKYDEEGIFKIPGTPPPVDEEESIGQRTRSKLSLSETPLEQIEQAFIPPDITTDMYDWDPETIDPEYKQFLTEYMKPLNQDPVAEDDPEADPEYNFMEDIETDMVDKEELREDRGVEIPRKELNDLIRSLYDFGDNNLKKEQEARKKKKNTENVNMNNENNLSNNTMIDLIPVLAEPELPKLVSFEQRVLLQIQLEQHVQLLTQNYLMTYKHPEYHSMSRNCKGNLDSLRYLANGPNSAFNVRNLEDARKTIEIWEMKLLDPKFNNEYISMINDEITAENLHMKSKLSYNPRFHPALKSLFMESKALLYPQLLPHTFPRIKGKSWNKFPYFASEENLILLGLVQYYPIVLQKNTKFKRKTDIMSDACQLIQKNLLPVRDFSSLLNYVKRSCRDKKPNFIKQFFENGTVPPTMHNITFQGTYSVNKTAPKDQPVDLLPNVWKNYEVEQCNFKRHSLRRILQQSKLTDKKTNVSTTEQSSEPALNILINVPTQQEPIRVTISDDTLRSVNLKVENTQQSSTETSSQLEESEVQHLTFEPVFIKCEQVFFDEGSMSQDSSHSADNLSPIDAKESANNMAESSSNPLEDTEMMAQSTGDIARSNEETEKVDEGYKLPQLRKTTPRLAKIRSAENMKLMAQVLGPKGPSSNCSNVKSKAKQDSSKTDDECSSTKGDNEDEIAELMLASTTIKKDTISRKKAKQARELENIKRLVEAENENNHEERAAKYAVSFFQKLQSSTINCDPFTFRSVVNLYLAYCDKVNALDQLEAEDEFKELQEKTSSDTTSSDISSAAMSSVASERSKDKYCDEKDELAAELYNEVCEKLSAHPELCSDFLLFLTPRQAALVNKSVEYTMLQKMREFINVAQVYFAKQPSRLLKITQALTSLAADPLCTIESVKDVMGPILKGHPVVMDLFLQVLPNGKPPNCLFASNMFENLICPVGPHDKNKIYTEDSAELYENIKLPVPTSQDEPYGGESCKCDCHNEMTDSKMKSTTEHCASCGTRFLNGRIYLQTPEGLRPAKITFPGADEEQLENIARVSLKTAEKIVAVPPVKRRKRNSKSESSDTNPKTNKSSPLKESDDFSEKSAPSKSRKSAKSPPKLSEQQRKTIKVEPGTTCTTSATTSKKTATATKGVREKRTDKKDAKINTVQIKQEINTDHDEMQYDSSFSTINDGNEVYDEITIEKMEFSSEPEDNDQIETDSSNINDSKPWTREEDALLLKKVKEGFNPNTFHVISESLKTRSVNDVKERCDVLFSLLKKMN